MTATPLDFLRTTLDAAEKDALAATPGPWEQDPQRVGSLASAEYWYVVDCTGAHPSKENAAHIARHDPAAVLRRITADRELIADLLAERHYVSDGDCWYTCAAATEERDGGQSCDDERRGKPCDCGRDDRVNRRVRRIAEGWGRTEGVSADADPPA